MSIYNQNYDCQSKSNAIESAFNLILADLLLNCKLENYLYRLKSDISQMSIRIHPRNFYFFDNTILNKIEITNSNF